MSTEEVKEFYKRDRKEYSINENKDFLTWFYEQLQSGYRPYLDISKIQGLIYKIVSWYELKYPDRDIEKQEGIIDSKFMNLDDITDYFSFEQLKYRLSDKELETLDCNYRACDGYDNFITFYITDKKSLENYKVNADRKTGVINLEDLFFLKNNIVYFSKEPNIEELYFKIKGSKSYDYSNLEKIILNHKIDLELRKKIIRFINLALIYSPQTKPEYGEIRARKFDQEISKNYNISIKKQTVKKLQSLETRFEKLSEIQGNYLRKKINEQFNS